MNIHNPKTPSSRRSRAVLGALKREPRAAASHRALSRQAAGAARRRGKAAASRIFQAVTKWRQPRAAAKG